MEINWFNSENFTYLDLESSVILKVFPIVGIDNEIAYSECTQVPKFSYNILDKERNKRRRRCYVRWVREEYKSPSTKLTLLHSKASALCSSFCLKQLLHLLLLNMFGANFLHSAPVPRAPHVEPPDISTQGQKKFFTDLVASLKGRDRSSFWAPHLISFTNASLWGLSSLISRENRSTKGSWPLFISNRHVRRLRYFDLEVRGNLDMRVSLEFAGCFDRFHVISVTFCLCEPEVVFSNRQVWRKLDFLIYLLKSFNFRIVCETHEPARISIVIALSSIIRSVH